MDMLRRQLRGVTIVLDELRQIPRYSAEAERRMRQLRQRYTAPPIEGAGPMRHSEDGKAGDTHGR